MSLSTRFCELVGIEHPVVQEGLGPYRLVHLAAAVSNAGGLGTVSMPGMTDPDGAKVLRASIEEACALTDRPFAVNVPVGADSSGTVLPFSAAYVGAVVDAVRDPEIAKRLRVVTTSAGPPGVVRHLIADSGLVHVHKVGSTKQALRAQRDGVDAIIASGYEAGGHTHARPVHTLILAPNVCAAVDIPVIVAGGIRDGATVAAAFALGADAVAMGTRFVATHDNPDWHPAYADAVVAMEEGGDVVFQAVYGPSRALRTPAIEELAAYEARPGVTVDDLTRWKDERLIAAQRDGVVDGGIMPMGQVASGIHDLVRVAEFVPGVMAEARTVLARLTT